MIFTDQFKLRPLVLKMSCTNFLRKLDLPLLILSISGCLCSLLGKFSCPRLVGWSGGGQIKNNQKSTCPLGWLVLSGRGKGKALEKDAYPAQDLSKSDPKVAAPRSEKVPGSLQDHIFKASAAGPSKHAYFSQARPWDPGKNTYFSQASQRDPAKNEYFSQTTTSGKQKCYSWN